MDRFRRICDHHLAFRHRMSEPYRTADNTVVPDVYVASQYGGSCIDDNVVSNVGMSLHVL